MGRVCPRRLRIENADPVSTNSSLMVAGRQYEFLEDMVMIVDEGYVVSR